MADDTKGSGTSAALPKTPGVSADTAAAIAQAMQISQLHPLGLPREAPTERVRLAADGIKRGSGVTQAMRDAGYGDKFVAGNAAGFPAFLEGLGLLTTAQARKAAGAFLTGGDA